MLIRIFVLVSVLPETGLYIACCISVRRCLPGGVEGGRPTLCGHLK